MATLAQFITKLRARTATRIFKIERLNANEEVVGEITANVLSGEISESDEDGTRVSASIVFDNSGGEFIPDPDNDLWISHKFKISTGLRMDDGSDYLVHRGIFLCSEPEITSSHDGESTCSVQFLDKFSSLNNQLGGTLESTYVIPVGTNITSAVQQILIDAGEIKSPIIEPTAEVTPFTITADAGGNFGELLINLSHMLSWSTYFDRDGYLRFQPRVEISTEGSSWDFNTTEVSYMASRHRYEFTKVFNKVIVIGDNIAGATIRGTASDTNVLSPTRIALIGTKAKVIQDDLISTTDLATQRAEAELLAAISLVEISDIDCLPLDILEAGKIITVTDSVSDMAETRFLVKSLSFPLTINSDMSLSCWKGRTLD